MDTNETKKERLYLKNCMIKCGKDNYQYVLHICSSFLINVDIYM